MRGQLTGPLTGPLADRAFRALDARLEPDVDRPVALALSGGGDSMALLDLACAWAGARGRRVLALTVDHRLNRDSADWSRLAQAAARAAGADWRGLAWDKPKPATGLPAAARTARHRLLAEAARAAGARVILTGHTADDVAEADWMRAEGSTLGRLRDWSPSPAWPEGRGLMLLRPLLGQTRQALREHLSARSLDWIEDPANVDPRFARSRARAALAETGVRSILVFPPPCDGSLPLAMGGGLFRVDRAVGARALAAALVCAGGGQRTPRGEKVEAIRARLAAGADFDAVLAGARLTARGQDVVMFRNAGEYARRPPPTARLIPGQAVAWDGRFEITARETGLRVAPAVGRLAALSRADRAWLKTLPPGARGGLPVLIRDDGSDPVLAWGRAEVRCLVERRLAQALDQTPHETDLDPAPNGATPGNTLSSFPNIH